MMISRFARALTTAIALLVISGGMAAQAAQPPKITQLSSIDKRYMSDQRASLDELARVQFGRQLRNDKDDDLALLQLLLDKQLVSSSQRKELQAMGVIMGDFLAKELKMHWVIYEDQLGRSRALRYKDSEHYLFPMTMISRRQEVDNNASVLEIYQRAVTIIKPQLPRAPYE